MKIKLLLLFLLAFEFSCSKIAQEKRQSEKQIVGTWELEFYSCGECIIASTAYPEGSGNIIEFSKGGQFIRRLKDSILFEGRYNIVTSKECTRSGDLSLKINEPPSPSEFFINFSDSKLQLSTPSCYADGAVSIYRRID